MNDKLKQITNNRITVTSTSSAEIHIVDYTEKTKSERGVEIQEQTPDDIGSLKINNESLLSITCNIFGHQSLQDNFGKDLKHCECALYPSSYHGKAWLLFVEIKDSKAKNIKDFVGYAKEQIIATVDYFRSNELIAQNRLVHAVISFPRRNKTAFYNQVIQSDDRSLFRLKHRIIIHAKNELHIIDDKAIR